MNAHINDFERVFNRNVPITGRGGGGKGGGSNDSNTLASRTTARLIEVISEGPIVGLIDGMKSVYFDKTPIISETNYENFPNVVMEEHKGYPDDTPFVGHNAVEAISSVETQVTIKNGAVVRTIIDPNVNAVRVIVRHPGLVSQNDDGELKRTSVAYAFDVRVSGGAWETAFEYTERNQKTMSTFQRSHRINLPEGGSPWDIRMRRITADSEKDELANDTFFDSFVTLVEGRFSYPHTAAVAMTVNAEDLGTELPQRVYKVRGRIIDVPSNYNPETRVYTGVWNGTFKKAWTDNPAWVFYDILLHDRYGLGEFVKRETVDKWGLYTIAQYCDQLVPSGFKRPNGTDIMEPRFTFNGVINGREEAFYVLQDITRAWRGMAYWAIGSVFATADMPADVAKIVSPANVIGGNFEYQSTALKARHSVVLVKWNNPENMYLPETEAVIDSELLHKYDWREKSLTLLGCTSRGLAHRYGKWIIDSEQNETETVTYAASFDHANVRPGELISVSDPHKAKVRAAGRIAEVNDLVVTLDAPFETIEGSSYTILVATPSGKIERRDIKSWLTDTMCTVDRKFNEEIQVEAMWQITGTDIVPRQYRVISVEEEEDNVFRITALFHDPRKFDRIEKGIVFEPLPYARNDKEVLPPTNLRVKEQGFISNGVSVHKLTLSWSPPINQLARGYYITVDTPENTRIVLGATGDTSIDLPNTTSGEYIFHVQTINVVGAMSVAASFEFFAAGAEGFARPVVRNLQTKEGGTEFFGRDLTIVWENFWPSSSNPTSSGGEPSSSYSPYYLDNEIRVYRADDSTLLRVAHVRGTEYTYTYEANRQDNVRLGHDGAERSIRIEIVCRDTIGRISNKVMATFSNPAPPAIAPEVYINGNEVYFGYPNDISSDFVGVLVWAEKASGYNPAITTPKYDGKNNPVTLRLDYDTVYYCRIAAYDAFGKDDLNYSTQLAITTMTDGVDIDPPAVPTGLKVTSSIVGGAAKMVVTWNAVSASDLAAYDLQVKEGEGNWVSIQCHEPLWESNVISGLVYGVRVRARDKNANSSAYSAIINHTAARDTIPPAVPTGLTVTAGINSMWLKWVSPTDADLSHIEVWESTTANFSAAVNIASVMGGSFARTGLATEQLRYYRLRAVDTSGNKSGYTAGVSATTASFPVPISLTPIGLLFKTAGNVVSWAAFTMSYNIGLETFTETVVAGSSTYSTSNIFIYYVPGSKKLTATTNIASVYVNEGKPIAVYRGGTNVQLTNGQVIIDGENIAAGTIGANQLATNHAIITGTAQIKAAVIEDAHIVNLDAAKIKSNSILSNSIVVGTGGDSLGTISQKASDPAKQINTASTKILPGKVTISGASTLESLLYGSDKTQIDGGKIATNTISANSLVIGRRGIEINGVTFEHNSPSANRISWTSGTIVYTDNAGAAKSVTITASNAAWTAGTLYIYWNINALTLASTTDYATANGNNRIILATYRGGKLINANYGQTVIEGGSIKSQTIVADQLASNAIEARHVKTDAVEARHVKTDQIIARHVKANSISAGHIAAKSINASHITADKIDAKVLMQNGTLITDLIAAYAVTDVAAITGNGNLSLQFASIPGGRRIIRYGSFGSLVYHLTRDLVLKLYRNGSLVHTAGTLRVVTSRTRDDSSGGYEYTHNAVSQGVFLDTQGSGTDTYEVRITGGIAPYSTYLEINSLKR